MKFKKRTLGNKIINFHLFVKKKNHRHYETIYYSLAQSDKSDFAFKTGRKRENKIVQSIKLKPIIVILVKCSFTRTSII